MRDPVFLTVEQVIAIHDEQLSRFGGTPGLRDPGLLESALEQPRATMFGNLLHPNLPSQAAAYLYHLARNHPFVDANKRTALASTLTFLTINGYPRAIKVAEAFDLTLSVAQGNMEKGALAEVIAEQMGWSAEAQLPVAEQDADFWREVDMTAMQQLGGLQDIPTARKLALGLQRTLVEHGLALVEFRTNQAGIFLDLQGNMLGQDLTFVTIPELKDRLEAAKALGVSVERVKQTAKLSEPQLAQSLAHSLKVALVRAGVLEIGVHEPNAFFGWQTEEDGFSTFTLRGLRINFMNAQARATLPFILNLNPDEGDNPQ